MTPHFSAMANLAGARRAGRLLLVLSVSCLPHHSAEAQDLDPLAVARALEQAAISAIAKAERGVVAISRVDAVPQDQPANFLDPFGAARLRQRLGPRGTRFIPDQFGSGVVLQSADHPDTARYVLTTYDVAYGSTLPSAAPRPERWRIFVRLASRDVVPVDAAIVAADRRSELVVLKLDLAGADLTPADVPVIPLGEGGSLRKGQRVFALGNPYAQGRDGSASACEGMIANIARRPAPPPGERGIAGDDATIHHYGTLLHVDTRLDLGSSGGALINLDGELVGITTSLAALQGYEKSVGYAIPLDAGLRRIIEDLMRGFEAEYGFLGIAPDSVARSDVRLGGSRLTQASAALASQVAVDSPAWQGGLRNGDIILEINGRTVYDDSDLMRLIGLLGPGADAELLVRRASGAETTSLTVRLGKWPVYDDSAIVSTARRYESWRGLDVDYPTTRRRFLSSDLLEAYRRAVVVTAVAEDSPAARAGLRPGEFIQQAAGVPVQTPAEFHAALDRTDGPVTLTLADGQRRVIPP